MAIPVAFPYQPLKGQRFAHRHMRDRYINLVRGGVGSGKTRFGVAETCRSCLHNSGKGQDTLIIAPTWSILHRTTLRRFLEQMPKAAIKQVHKNERWIRLRNGRFIWYGSADRPETLEGADVAFIWGDEARYYSKAAWDIIVARARVPAPRGGILLTTTPSMGWLYDEFGHLMAEHEGRRYTKFRSSDDPDKGGYILRTEDNHHNDPRFLGRLRRMYSRTLYRAYVNGEWVHLEGSVYGDALDLMSLSGGTLRSFDVDPGSPVDLGFDPGLKGGWLFTQERYGCDYIIGQLMPTHLTTEETCQRAVRWLKDRGLHPGTVYMDPSGVSRNRGTMESDVKVVRRYFPHVWWAQDSVRRSVRYGIDLVRQRLLGYDGVRRLFVARDLYHQDGDNPRGVIAGLRGYVYSDRPGVEEPVKDDVIDHVMDCLRYIVVGKYGRAEAADVMDAWSYEDRQADRRSKWP